MSQANKSKSGKLDEISLVLPTFAGLTSLSEGGNPLLGDLGQGSSYSPQVKLQAIEAFLDAAVRDCTYTEMVTDLLLAVMNTVHSEAASVLEVDHEKRFFFFRCSAGRASDRLAAFTIPLEKGIAGQVVASGMPVIIDNAEENIVHLKQIGDAVGFQTLNMLAVPLVIRGRVYGVLELLNRVGQPNYSNADLEVTKYLCEVAAKILELRMMIAWGKEILPIASPESEM